MIVAANICKAATAVVVGTLTIASGRNMLQTRRLCRQQPTASVAVAAAMDLPSTTAQDLQTLSREQLLQLFLHECKAPSKDMRSLQGDWNGELLCNNGLTRVTRFITNRLFGKGRIWNGKSFRDHGKGVNQFERYKNQRDSSNQWTVTLATEEAREFRYAIAPSDYDSSSLSLRLEYKHSLDTGSMFFSPWQSMVDEVRVLNDNVLIGMGRMQWSGGKLNCSPFCLYRIPSSRRGIW